MKIRGSNFLSKIKCYYLDKKLNIFKNSKIIEIASGNGNLSKFLNNKCNSKIIEIDINNIFKNSTIESILNINFRFYGRVILYGNIPYNITSKVMKTIKNYKNIFEFYVMIQIDFLSKINIYFKKIIKIKCFRNIDFIPKPRVNSVFVKII
ncbi:rRNA adenine N-6-methyltransferase family protein [Candidatus Vidania fulgoroideorum]